MRTFLLLSVCCLFISSCRQTPEDQSAINSVTETELKFAESFSINSKEGYTEVTINRPWPGAEDEFRYALVSDPSILGNLEGYDAIVQVPLKNLVVTSTTHIPSLEMLESETQLLGFPNLDYISSEKTRALIDQGKITELGMNDDLNTEVLIEISPEVLITFAVSGGNKAVETVERAGIPVLYNADWTEVHPLGKAEWIKFFGLLLGKSEQANALFDQIEKDYLEAKQLASKAADQPTVLSGAMYKDVWYLPAGESWAASFIADAHGTYLWGDSEGSGSLSLNLESVLEKGQSAQFWIGPGQYIARTQLAEAHNVYTQFQAFAEGNIYTFTQKKGPTGGVIYYELAPNRPDLVLKDMIHILHPELMPEHELYFFSPLDP
ncbi:ABC transporter substrate-binding protein [Aureitalea marina]|uniref:ABC transporter substrate-binding protein n=1 Tax=Aureitalea marina TaxID=930804 RepID=A0A2S7KTM0_9FLAO|nr:ABC transporter substrate-binding protein [Aureitalea marina]PQB05982.1 ABC transporter substrate-binding protein [Aureitalea marina]